MGQGNPLPSLTMARIKYSTVSIAIISASLSAVVVLSLSSLHHVQSGHSSSYHVVQETRKLEASRRAVMVAMTEPIAQVKLATGELGKIPLNTYSHSLLVACRKMVIW